MDLPTIRGVSLFLDETGEYPCLIVTASEKIPPEVVRLCHQAAGDAGATIKFRLP